MKEVKLKERLENAYEAFFTNEKLNENDSLSLKNNESSSNEQTPFFSENTKKVFNIFRQIFLFLPANFMLFFMSVVLTGVFLLRPSNGGGSRWFLILIVFLLTSLMTVLGLGSSRNPKHYLIPLSTILIGIFTGTIGSIFLGDEGFGYFIRNYLPYFIPLAYIAPVLVKSWVDRTDD